MTTVNLKVDNKKSVYATGRRKSSVARVFVQPGSGKTRINGRDINEYFGEETRWLNHAVAPLHTLKVAGEFDIIATIKGGGVNGQSGALRLGIARALDQIGRDKAPASDEAGQESLSWRSVLKKEGYLTSDSRRVLRKLVGLVKARRAKQFSKR